MYDVEFEGKTYKSEKKSWVTNKQGMERLIAMRRVQAQKTNIRFVRFHDDFPYQDINN